jgi:hypothetical protein
VPAWAAAGSVDTDLSSNSAACLSFITVRVSASVCWPVSGCGETLVTLVTLPSTLIAGGRSAVRNRSDPLREIISRNRSLMNLVAWSRSIWRGLQLSASEPASTVIIFAVLQLETSEA